MPTNEPKSSQGDGQVYAETTDYYELLQISPNADPDTVTRVFRLLARRYHPDQPDTGNEEKFREILAAYAVLNDPEKRAHYDVNHTGIRRERWRFVAEGAPTAGDYVAEQQVRLVVLEILYSRRRTEPHKPGLSLLDLAELMGQPLEHLEFSSWYLVMKKLVVRNDQSQLQITADGVDYLEEHRRNESPRLRLTERTTLGSH
ncbi:Chaperone protein DnaJ [Luteitalea pratensis]|uniref:Chaperone protein DnaJ n=1 Tax=Luteitalea pratensis TaxID=1855912 RepID=A0A143PNH0_LUTPR|nr:DnaJ domain-containing protein [Luteitalea pratensis]AMY10207.1 Chaperone protein DnaJ [Luteitalea pratensis]